MSACRNQADIASKCLAQSRCLHRFDLNAIGNPRAGIGERPFRPQWLVWISRGRRRLGSRFKLSARFRSFFRACAKILSECRRPDRPICAEMHIVSTGVGRCVFHLTVSSGRCVSPANTGWDWLEFRPANEALRSGLSSAAPAIASRKFPLP
jgi:hypothetical protein